MTETVWTEQVGHPTALRPNTYALAGGVTGIVAASLTPFLFWLPWLVPMIAAVGIALSAEGLRRTREGYDRRGWAVAGLSTAIPAFVLTGIWTALFWAGLLISMF